jgi:DNA (cytosine-5)-methyltransferase 1
MNFIDLFAGCGGLLDGFMQEGNYHELASVEWEINPCNTLRNRLLHRWGHVNAENEVVRFDIQRTDELFNGYNDEVYGHHEGLDALIADRPVHAIIGGPPCQAYSLAGRIRDPHGMRDDYRNYLFESYIRVLQHYRPQVFVFENVVGLLSAIPDGTPIREKIRESFINAGYRVIENFHNVVYDVADFGVPQHRKRLIIMGIRIDLFNDDDYTDNCINRFYELLNEQKAPRKTVNEAIGDLPKLYPSKDIIKQDGHKYSHIPIVTDVPNHIPRFHSKRDINVFRMLAEDIASGRNEYVSIDKLKELYTKVTGKKSNIHKYYVLRSNEPSNTIPAHLYKDGMRHIHPDPEQARSITVREAARLQSFADDFVFIGPMMAQYKMIGNAVPPHFALAIAHALINTYNELIDI